jgi:hypothetical protein
LLRRWQCWPSVADIRKIQIVVGSTNGAIPAGGSVTITITATVNNGTQNQTLCNQGNINFDADGNGINEATALTDNPAVGGGNDQTCFVAVSGSAAEIPTLGELGLAALCLLLAGAAMLRLRRRAA